MMGGCFGIILHNASNQGHRVTGDGDVHGEFDIPMIERAMEDV